MTLYTAPAKCACCQKCLKEPVTGRCQYGGPFGGYEKTDKGK